MRNSSKGHLWRCHLSPLVLCLLSLIQTYVSHLLLYACIFWIQHLGGRIIPFVLFCDHLCWIVSGLFEDKKTPIHKMCVGRSLRALLCLRAHDRLCSGETSFGLKWGWGFGAFSHGFLHGRHFPLWYTSKPWISICTLYFLNGIILWEEWYLL